MQVQAGRTGGSGKAEHRLEQGRAPAGLDRELVRSGQSGGQGQTQCRPKLDKPAAQTIHSDSPNKTRRQ